MQKSTSIDQLVNAFANHIGTRLQDKAWLLWLWFLRLGLFLLLTSCWKPRKLCKAFGLLVANTEIGHFNIQITFPRLQ